MVLPVALILLGLILLAVEVYLVPGVGVIGIAGGLALIGGVVMAFVELGPMGGLIAAAASVAVAGALGYVAWQTGALQRIVLGEALARDFDAEERDADTRSRLLGREGRAVTPLRPGGVAEIEGERIEVQTEGGFIAAGSRIRVVAMDRRRFFVRLADEPA